MCHSSNIRLSIHILVFIIVLFGWLRLEANHAKQGIFLGESWKDGEDSWSRDFVVNIFILLFIKFNDC